MRGRRGGAASSALITNVSETPHPTRFAGQRLPQGKTDRRRAPACAERVASQPNPSSARSVFVNLAAISEWAVRIQSRRSSAGAPSSGTFTHWPLAQ